VRIKNAIDRIWTNHPCYGYRSIRIAMRDQGIKIGKKRLVRYLKEMGITTIYPGPNLRRRNKQHRTYPYLLRNVEIKHPNQAWSIDLTYVGMVKGFMYLALIIDWDSRLVVGHALSNTLHAGFVVDCVRQAIARHGKQLIMNSDQGAQFTSDDYSIFSKSSRSRSA
jgi:putative transposase